MRLLQTPMVIPCIMLFAISSMEDQALTQVLTLLIRHRTALFHSLRPNTSAVPIPGNPALSIDPITGMITGVATQTGQFVVGICVSEYDNGVLKSTVRRDYQFNVTNCIVNVVADMLTQVENSTNAL